MMSVKLLLGSGAAFAVWVFANLALPVPSVTTTAVHSETAQKGYSTLLGRDVTHRGGALSPFNGPYLKEKRKGKFHCSGCDLEYFS